MPRSEWRAFIQRHLLSPQQSSAGGFGSYFGSALESLSSGGSIGLGGSDGVGAVAASAAASAIQLTRQASTVASTYLHAAAGGVMGSAARLRDGNEALGGQ